MSEPTPQPEPQRAAGDASAIATAEAVTLLVDTHVHLYAEHVDAMLDAAARRIASYGAGIAAPKPALPCLMLTETARDCVFAELLGRDDSARPWQRAGEAQGAALWLEHAALGRLLLIAGGQTVTSEGVEVLSLGTRERFEDGRPIAETIEAVLTEGALAVLPYGLGKWLGGRGKVVAQAFEAHEARGVRLGDNAGRPRPLADPALFKQSAHLGHKVLPGSDPLRTGKGRASGGGYGVVIEVASQEQGLDTAVVEALRSLPTGTPTFGGRVGLGRCVSEQIALRLNKHLGR